jgi:hypothetical protein
LATIVLMVQGQKRHREFLLPYKEISETRLSPYKVNVTI